MESSNEAENPQQTVSDDEDLPNIQEHEADEVIVLDQASTSTHLPDSGQDIDLEDEHPPPQIPDDAVIVLSEHTSEVLAVAASPTKNGCIITGGMDDVGLIWDLEMRAVIAKVDGADESVSTVAFSCDGKYAAFGSENGAISVVFMDGSPAPGAPLDGPGDTVHFLSWHPRGPVLLAGSEDNVAYMWNAAKSSFMMAFVGHEDAVLCGGFSTDGKSVVTGSKDYSVRIWNPSSGETLLRIQTGIAGIRGAFHKAHILCIANGAANSPAEKLIVSGCAEGDVFVSHRETGQIITQLPLHKGGVECVVFCPNPSHPMWLASTGGDGVVRIWDMETNSERCKLVHGGVVPKAIWHPTLPVVASCSSDGNIIIWNILTASEVLQLKGHSAFISDFCFTTGNDFIASTSGDGTVRIFDVRVALSQIE